MKLSPGVYDCRGAAPPGESAIAMRAYVDLVGSGRNVTRIVGDGISPETAVVTLADHAELKGLTVETVAAPSSGAHALWLPEGVSGGVSSVSLSGPGDGAALIGCADSSGRIVLRDSELSGASVVQGGCSAVLVRSRLDTAVLPAGQRCVGSYDGNFAALDDHCKSVSMQGRE